MRRHTFRPRSISVVLLLAFSLATLSTTAARAQSPSLSEERAAPIAPISPPPPTAQREPIELREAIWGDRYGRMLHAKVPFQRGEILEGGDLYRALGRDDLARRYDLRVAAKIALAVAGFTSIIAGAVLLGETMPQTTCGFGTPMYPYMLPPTVCHTDGGGGGRDAGIAMVMLAPILMLTGGLIDPQPVGVAERERLIAAYNASLAHPAASGASAPSRSAATRFAATPTVSPGGAGVTFGAQF